MTDPHRAYLRDALKEAEGYRRHPYRDTRKVLTIGYGRNLDHVGIDKEEAAYLLERDIDTAVRLCVATFAWFPRLDSVRQVVVTEMAFNLGINRLLGFRKMLRAIAKGQYELAAVEMLSSLWADQVGQRADRLAVMMRSGMLPEGEPRIV